MSLTDVMNDSISFDSQIFKGAHNIAGEHTKSIVAGGGLDVLGPRAIEMLVDFTSEHREGLQKTLGESAYKLGFELFKEAINEAPMFMMRDIQMITTGLINGDLLGKYEPILLRKTLESGAGGMVQTHLALLDSDPEYRERFKNGST
jgi:hypothetical protein